MSAITIQNPQRPRLLFIGHAFHKRTNSSAFFVEILSQTFEVCTISLDPSQTFDVAPLLDKHVEAVCLWQLDYLAPIFSSRGMRTIVVPMYDGSSILPDRHWLQMQGCRILNFSLRLHERLVALGLDSLFFRYYPDPAGVTQITNFDSRRLFFWQRVPLTFLNIDEMLQLFGPSVDSIHIHAAPDNGRDDLIRVPAGAPPVTLSRWFESQDDYLDALEHSNIFVAPRLSEGIGQAFLEAMVRGMAVVAYALPTHTEYIEHGQNGIIISEGNTAIHDFLDCAQLRRIGTNARLTVEKGFRIWKLQAESVCNIILDTPVQLSVPRTICDDRRLIDAYQAGIEVYSSYLNALPTSLA